MNFALLLVTLALIWAAITGVFSLANLLLGAIIAFGALWFVREQVAGPQVPRRVRRAIALSLLFVYELVLSALKVAFLVVTPNLKSKLSPGIIAFPLKAKSDAEITLLANLITLTPGTLSLDVSEDRKYIFVHAISVPKKSELIKGIAEGFEKKVMEVFE